MSLPPLATTADITARAPELTLNATQAAALIADASAVIRAYAGRDWVNDAGSALEGIPDGIPGVCAMMVIRALRVPEGVSQEAIGNYSVTYSPYASDRLYLTRTEKAFIKRAVSSGGAFSISTYGEVGYLGTDEDLT